MVCCCQRAFDTRHFPASLARPISSGTKMLPMLCRGVSKANGGEEVRALFRRARVRAKDDDGISRRSQTTVRGSNPAAST